MSQVDDAPEGVERQEIVETASRVTNDEAGASPRGVGEGLDARRVHEWRPPARPSARRWDGCSCRTAEDDVARLYQREVNGERRRRRAVEQHRVVSPGHRRPCARGERTKASP